MARGEGVAGVSVGESKGVCGGGSVLEEERGEGEVGIGGKVDGWPR